MEWSDKSFTIIAFDALAILRQCYKALEDEAGLVYCCGSVVHDHLPPCPFTKGIEQAPRIRDFVVEESFRGTSYGHAGSGADVEAPSLTTPRSERIVDADLRRSLSLSVLVEDVW